MARPPCTARPQKGRNIRAATMRPCRSRKQDYPGKFRTRPSKGLDKRTFVRYIWVTPPFLSPSPAQLDGERDRRFPGVGKVAGTKRLSDTPEGRFLVRNRGVAWLGGEWPQDFGLIHTDSTRAAVLLHRHMRQATVEDVACDAWAWIPAFAGMTEGWMGDAWAPAFAGETGKGTGSAPFLP